MADTESFSEDISALWGAPERSVLEPSRPNGTVRNGHDPEPDANGSQPEVVAEDPRPTIARLADALGGRQVDVVRRSELEATRAELEDAFTHQLAVAIYEVLSASNDRFAAVEGHIDQRLDGISGELKQFMEAQSDRLAAAMDTQQRATADIARSVRQELAETSERFSGPVEALVPFQREIRHGVGRIGDMVATHAAEAVRRSEIDAERTAEAGAALLQRLEVSERQDAAATQELEHIAESIASVQRELSALHEALVEVRAEVTVLRRRNGARRRWGRSSDHRGEDNRGSEE